MAIIYSHIERYKEQRERQELQRSWMVMLVHHFSLSVMPERCRAHYEERMDAMRVDALAERIQRLSRRVQLKKQWADLSKFYGHIAKCKWHLGLQIRCWRRWKAAELVTQFVLDASKLGDGCVAWPRSEALLLLLLLRLLRLRLLPVLRRLPVLRWVPVLLLLVADCCDEDAAREERCERGRLPGDGASEEENIEEEDDDEAIMATDAAETADADADADADAAAASAGDSSYRVNTPACGVGGRSCDPGALLTFGEAGSGRGPRKRASARCK